MRIMEPAFFSMHKTEKLTLYSNQKCYLIVSVLFSLRTCMTIVLIYTYRHNKLVPISVVSSN